MSARFLGPPGILSIDWEVPLGAISTAASGLGRPCQRQFSAPSFDLDLSHYKKKMSGSQPVLSLGQPRAKEVIHVDKHQPGCLVPLVTLTVVKL